MRMRRKIRNRRLATGNWQLAISNFFYFLANFSQLLITNCRLPLCLLLIANCQSPSAHCQLRIGGEGGDEVSCFLGGDRNLRVRDVPTRPTFFVQPYASKGGSDIFILCQKADNQAFRWLKTLGSTSNDILLAADIDAQQNLYVVGSFNKDLFSTEGLSLQQTPNPALFLLKMNPYGGNTLDKNHWRKRQNRSASITPRRRPMFIPDRLFSR